MPLLIFDIYLFCRLRDLIRQRAHERSESAQEVADPEPAVPAPVLVYTYPTDQRNLHDTESTEVYQPTASGRVESALYGSVRTVRRGQHFLPSFHAGIDIAPMQRDRRGRPQDEVRAVTDGSVAYINPIEGNSNYGIYVVLVHNDPVGKIYTLYAHLARTSSGLKTGKQIRSGDILGIMGNTDSTGMPMHRAHLHFEIGVINNMHFHEWYRKQNQLPDHGTFHGHNLTGLNPLAIYGQGGDNIEFNMLEYLRTESPAFKLLFRHTRQLDYFERYAALWEGPPYSAEAMVMAVSEGGAPLIGRPAAENEIALLGDRQSHILEVDENVLARNGRRIIIKRDGEWQLSRNGERWLEIFTYSSDNQRL